MRQDSPKIRFKNYNLYSIYNQVLLFMKINE